MALRKGLPAKKANTDADDTRYDMSGLVVCNADGTPRSGVLSPVGVNLVTATATMNVSVARFQGVAVRDSGVVLLANDGPANVLLDAAPAANKRLDVVWAKQNDSSSTVTVPDVDDLPVFGVSKGTAGAIPDKPSIPDGALELATVEVPSTATATNSSGVVITQSAQFTAAVGGVVPFRTVTEMEAVTSLPSGTTARVLSDNGEYVSDGAGWSDATPLSHRQIDGVNSVARTSIQSGTGRIAGVASTSIDVPVTFPVPFASVPDVTFSSAGLEVKGAFDPTTGAQTGLYSFHYNTSATGFTGAIGRASAMSTTFDYYYTWVAIGVLA